MKENGKLSAPANSVKPVLNLRPRRDGRYTLILQIICNRRRGVVFTPYALTREEFDAQKGVVLPLTRSRAARDFAREANEHIQNRIQELRSVIASFETTGRPYKPTDVTSLFRRKADRRFLRTYVLSLIEELVQQEKHGTARTYMSTLVAFEKFMGHQKCRLEEINTERLTAFTDYMHRLPLKRNTISFYIRCLRAIYNKAVRENLVHPLQNPFDTITLREDKTRKLAVDVGVLKRLSRIRLDDAPQRLARDLFLFSFYARGMSFVDMAYLKRVQIRGEVLYYNRRKTGQPFSVRITEPMAGILERYDNSGPWVFPLMTEQDGRPLQPLEGEDETLFARRLHKRYRATLAWMSHYLDELSVQMGLEKKLSFNVARHTWASMARNKGIPVAVISGGLGHTSEKTTIIYLDEIDAHRIDEANDIVTRF